MTHLGDFEQLIMFSVLELDEEASGVTIRELIEHRTGRLVSLGAIYTTLGRLEERGLLSSSVGEPRPGRPGRPRKRYRLRAEGARALMDAYDALQAMAGGLIPKLTKLAEG